MSARVRGSPRSWSLLTLVPLSIAAVIAIVVSVAFLVVAKIESGELARVEQEKLDDRISVYLGVLESELGNADFSGIAQSTEIIASEPTIAWVQVRSGSGLTISEGGAVETVDGDIRTRVVYRDGGSGVELGRIQVGPDHSAIQPGPFPVVTYIPLILAAVLVGLLSSVVVRRLVVVPVVRIDEVARSFDGHQFVELGHIEGPREIANLAASFETAANGLVTTLRDLEQSNEQLRYQVHRREETEAALREAQKYEMIGQLSRGIAHDYNNMLSVMLGNIELAQVAAGTDVAMAHLDMARNAILRAAESTRQLSAFAQQMPLKIESLDINVVVSELMAMIEGTFPENIELSVAQPPALWPAATDYASIQNALLNLLINARDAMPDGGLLMLTTANTVVVEGHAGDHPGTLDPGRYVAVTVSDTGSGIPVDLVGRIFEPFFTTKGAGHGSGMGLAMVHGFVNQAGGAVGVDSAVGAGSTFTLYLPASTERAVEGGHAAVGTGADVVEGRIMLCEDNEQVAETMRLQLERAQYSVDVYFSADEAFEAFCSVSTYDLLITDLALPGRMQGNDLVRNLRRRNAGLRAVVVSGHAGAAIATELANLDGVVFLEKPIQAADLLRAVSASLDIA